jgi:hypothetical protein
MASERQINANRKNAQKSTGPKSDKGKFISSLNATVRHVIRCRDAVVLSGGENYDQYLEFCDAFHHEYRPSTPTQIALVQDLARMFYRVHRYARIEAGALDSAVDYICKGNRDYAKFNSRRDDDRAIGDAAGFSNYTMPILESNSRMEQRLRNSIFKTIRTILDLQKLNPPLPPGPEVTEENHDMTNEPNSETPVESTKRLAVVPNPVPAASQTLPQTTEAVPEVAAGDLAGVENIIK